jgi:hypothetical protein
MSVLLVSPLHIASLATAISNVGDQSELLKNFFEKMQMEVVFNNDLHPIDIEISKYLINFKYCPSFKFETFEVLASLFVKAMTSAINGVESHTPKTNYEEYRSLVLQSYTQAKTKVSCMQHLQFIKLLNCYKYQISEIKNIENTLIFKLITDVEKHSFNLFYSEYSKLDYVI